MNIRKELPKIKAWLESTENSAFIAEYKGTKSVDFIISILLENLLEDRKTFIGDLLIDVWAFSFDNKIIYLEEDYLAGFQLGYFENKGYGSYDRSESCYADFNLPKNAKLSTISEIENSFRSCYY